MFVEKETEIQDGLKCGKLAELTVEMRRETDGFGGDDAAIAANYAGIDGPRAGSVTDVEDGDGVVRRRWSGSRIEVFVSWWCIVTGVVNLFTRT